MTFQVFQDPRVYVYLEIYERCKYIIMRSGSTLNFLYNSSQHSLHRPDRKRTATKRVLLGYMHYSIRLDTITNLHAVKNML